MNVSLTSELEQYVREKVDSGIEIELLEMANDPQIQREIVTIELDFSTTSMDGLQR